MDPPPGQGISVSLRVARAMSLARQGKVEEARTMLSADQSIPNDPLSLEVLAVILTSEGDYLGALQLWEQLRQRNPSHAEAKRMVAAIELWLSRPSWARYVPVAFATIVAVLMVGLFLALTWEPARPSRPTAPSGRTPNSSAPLPPARTTPASNDRSSPVATPEVNFSSPKQPPRHR